MAPIDLADTWRIASSGERLETLVIEVPVAHHVCSVLIDSRDIASAKAAGVV